MLRMLLQSVVIQSPDVGLLRYSTPLPFPVPLTNLTQNDFDQGVAFCVHNNIWNTNYPLWLPFNGTDDATFGIRFSVFLN